MVLSGEVFNSLCQVYCVPWKSLHPLLKFGGHVQVARHPLRGINDPGSRILLWSFWGGLSNIKFDQICARHISVLSLILADPLTAKSSCPFLLYACWPCVAVTRLLLTEGDLQADDRTNAVLVPRYR